MGDEEGTTTKRLYPLEALRFGTAVHVVCYYLFEPKESGPLKNLIRWGVASPSFFFVLSGFVLAINYWEQKENYNVKKFYMKRFARIYPAYMISILLFAWRDPMEYVSDGPKLWKLLWHLLGIQAWYVEDDPYTAGCELDEDGKIIEGGCDDPGWCISVLIFLYAVFPLILKTATENFNSRKSKALVILLLWPMPFVIWTILKEADLFEFDFTLPILHLPAFFIGVVTGGLYMVDRPAYNTNLLLVLLNKFAFSGVLLLIAILFTTTSPTSRADYLWKTGIIAPGQAFVVYWVAVGTDVTMQFLKPSFIWGPLGGMSYGIYLFHYHADLFATDCNVEMWDFYIFVLFSLVFVVRYLVEVPASEWIMSTFYGSGEGGE